MLRDPVGLLRMGRRSHVIIFQTVHKSRTEGERKERRREEKKVLSERAREKQLPKILDFTLLLVEFPVFTQYRLLLSTWWGWAGAERSGAFFLGSKEPNKSVAMVATEFTILNKKASKGIDATPKKKRVKKLRRTRIVGQVC